MLKGGFYGKVCCQQRAMLCIFTTFVKKSGEPQGLFYALCTVALLMTSCTMKYSFTGASIPPEVKTISIHYLKNTALLVKPTLSQQLTDELRNRFSTQTSLTPVNQNGDFDISGEITNYATHRWLSRETRLPP